VWPVSLTLPFASREAEEFQRALEQRPTLGLPSGTIGGYVEVAGRLGDLMPRAALAPDPAYRAELQARLITLATTLGTERAKTSAEPSARARGQRPEVGLSLLRGWRRTAAAVTAAVVALMLGVGFASASALPGGLLYPVKELIQSAQVHLAKGDLSQGKVLLNQTAGHIADAGTLVGQGDPDPADVDSALRSASSDLASAHELLLAQYAKTRDPAALTALAQFATAQSPILDSLRGRVPVVSVPLVVDLLAQLGQTATDVRHVVAQCGSTCASVPVANLPGPDGVIPPGGAGASGLTGSGGLGGLGGLLGSGGTTGGSGSGTGGSNGTGSSAGVTVGSGGAGVNLPGVGATVPAPHVDAGSGGVSVTVPKATATVGPVHVTVPGVGVILPGGKSSSHSSGHPASSPSASSSSSVCVLIICIG
jgi:Domain of unknown function (DUF5667)